MSNACFQDPCHLSFNLITTAQRMYYHPGFTDDGTEATRLKELLKFVKVIRRTSGT